jgi:hypothetical protein
MTELTNKRMAWHCARLAKIASDEAVDLLERDVTAHDLAEMEKIDDFVASIANILDEIGEEQGEAEEK